MQIKQFSLAVIGMLFFPVISGAQEPTGQTFTEVQQHFEQEKSVYRYWVNEAANKLDDPETEEDESQWYKAEVKRQQDYDDRRAGMDVAYGRYYEQTESIVDQQSEQCPEEQTCKQKIAMLETLAYEKEIECVSEKLTGEDMRICMWIVNANKERAAQMKLTCTTYPDSPTTEYCQQLVKEMKQQLQTIARGYMDGQAQDDANRPTVSYEIPYYDESKDLHAAYTFNTQETLEKRIKRSETGERNMLDRLQNPINNEEDVQNYYNQNYTYTPYIYVND